MKVVFSIAFLIVILILSLHILSLNGPEKTIYEYTGTVASSERLANDLYAIGIKMGKTGNLRYYSNSVSLGEGTPVTIKRFKTDKFSIEYIVAPEEMTGAE